MSVKTVLLLAILFWSTGSLVCLGLSFKLLLFNSDEPRFAALNEKYHWARWGSFDAGLLLGVLQAGLLFVPLARREAVRIVSLDKPRCIDFFPPAYVFLVLCTAITCAVVERLTAQYYVSVITFIGLLAAVGTALLAGSFRLCIVLCAPPPRSPSALRATLLLAAGVSVDEAEAGGAGASSGLDGVLVSGSQDGPPAPSCEESAHGAVSPLAAAAEAEFGGEGQS